MIPPNAARLLAVALLLLPWPALAQSAADPLAGAQACAKRNLPRTTLELRATFTEVDRVGGERASRAKVLGKKLADGLQRAVLRFDRPTDIRGTAMLMIENPSGPSEFYVFSPAERRVRRISGRSSGGLFGTVGGSLGRRLGSGLGLATGLGRRLRLGSGLRLELRLIPHRATHRKRRDP